MHARCWQLHSCVDVVQASQAVVGSPLQWLCLALKHFVALLTVIRSYILSFFQHSLRMKEDAINVLCSNLPLLVLSALCIDQCPHSVDRGAFS